MRDQHDNQHDSIAAPLHADPLRQRCAEVRREAVTTVARSRAVRASLMIRTMRHEEAGSDA